MSKYEKIKDRKNRDFKRLSDVRKATFQKTVEPVVIHEKERKKLPGRPLKLSYEDQVLMMPEYLREYRTYYHIAADYGISGANCYKLIKKQKIYLSNQIVSDCLKGKNLQRKIQKSELYLPMLQRHR